MSELEKHLAEIQRLQVRQLNRLATQHMELADKKDEVGDDPSWDLKQGAEAARRAKQIATTELIRPS